MKPTFKVHVFLVLRLHRLLCLTRRISEPLGQIKLLGKLAENKNRRV